MFFNFVFNIFYCTLGFLDTILDILFKRQIIWHKTERFRQKQDNQDNNNNNNNSKNGQQ